MLIKKTITQGDQGSSLRDGMLGGLRPGEKPKMPDFNLRDGFLGAGLPKPYQAQKSQG